MIRITYTFFHNEQVLSTIILSKIEISERRLHSAGKQQKFCEDVSERFDDDDDSIVKDARQIKMTSDAGGGQAGKDCECDVRDSAVSRSEVAATGVQWNPLLFPASKHLHPDEDVEVCH